MKATELMVGDWVKIKGLKDPKRISCIDESTGTVDFWNDEGLIVTSIDKVLPIPLTGEILEKNGFCMVASGDFQKDNGEDICRCWTYERDNVDITISHSYALIRLKDKHHYINEPTSIVINCYIHELQHALRLCGINKEIQL